MNVNAGLPLVAPTIPPPLDSAFRPAVLANRAFREAVARSGSGIPVGIALEQQNDGNISHFRTSIFSESQPEAAGNFIYLERICRFLLWSRGGYKFHVQAPDALVRKLGSYYKDTPTGQFDSNIVARKMFDRPLEVVAARELPPEKTSAASLGRHLEGCRIGFDLGGSDRKAAALIDGKVIFSEETVWDPYFQADPAYHYTGIMDSLKKAAAHLPRVDAIGGSAAGIYRNNQVKVASLFRGVPEQIFEAKVRNMFREIQAAWGNVPFEVMNDGEVTALAGSMSMNLTSILGLSMGTSTAGGYVNREGNVTSWISELAFVPLDYNPQAARDEWSGDYGCNVQYFSQQCVGRLLPAAGIHVPANTPLPEKLKHVQQMMEKGDERALRIYESIGVYLGYGAAHFADFYDLENILILGRVTSGSGGDVILSWARKILENEFPPLASKIRFHIPNEKDKRHGQAIAAASLPQLNTVAR